MAPVTPKLIKRVSSEFIYGRRKSSRKSSESSQISDRVLNLLTLEEKKEYDDKNGILASIGYDPSKRIWDPEFIFVESQRMLKMALTSQQGLEDVLAECDLNMYKSYFYPMVKGCIVGALAGMTMDRDLIAQATDCAKICAEMAYQLKPKKSWKTVLFRPDYNKYTDEEILSEIVYCGSVGAIGGLIFMQDKTPRGLLSAAVHFNKCYKLYFEAQNIHKYRTKWDHPFVKKQFDMGMKLALGITNLVFSFAPTKIAKFLTIVGFHSELDKALDDIRVVADSSDTLTYIPAAMSLMTYYGLIMPIYGVGEIRKDIVCELTENFLKCDLYGNLVYFVLGAREMACGNLEQAIEYEKKTKRSLDYLGNLTFPTETFNLLGYIILGRVDEACATMEMFDKLKIKSYSPSFLIYIHAATLREKMANGHPELEEVIQDKLREIKTCRGFFLLKRIFYEKMMAFRAAMFSENVKGWLLPYLEILYVGNFLYVIENKPQYINPLLKRVEDTMSDLAKNDPDYWDHYAYLLFLKAFLLKLRGDLEDALTYFHEILSLESILEKEVHIIPQTCLEIALIHRTNKKIAETKRWISKTSKYSEYVTEFVVGWRCKYVMEHLEKVVFPYPETVTHLPTDD